MRLRLAVAVVLVVLLAWYGAIDPADPRWDGFDLHRYEAMRLATPHLADVRQPEAYRLAGPWLAALVGWRAVTWPALLGSAALLWRWLRGEGVGEREAAVAVLLFGFSRPLFGQLAWNPYQAGDALGLVALLAVLLAVQTRRWPLFAVALALGLLARETPILAVPVALVVDRRAWRWCLPGIAVAVGLRLAIRPAWGEPPWVAASYQWRAKVSAPLLARAALTFAPAVPLLAVRSARRSLRQEHLALLLATFASSLCGADVERLLLPAVPVVALGVAHAVGGWPRWAIGALLGLGATSALHHTLGTVQLPDRTWTIAVTLGATAAVVAVGWAASWDVNPDRDRAA